MESFVQSEVAGVLLSPVPLNHINKVDLSKELVKCIC